MDSPGNGMKSFVARLGTFEQRHQLTKRRASSNSSKRKGGNTVEWPHKQPSIEALARAGFFYQPGPDSLDNVQCFLCTVRLDGWEATDDPCSEHLAHSKGCPWAIAVSVTRDEGTEKPPEDRDPLSEELCQARNATFHVGDGWPHEGKKGWKCKIAKMVEAGWCWDPSAEGDEPDGVTCFYCTLSLDGWEPKDDPFVEHKRRAPDCRYFQLLEQYHGTADPPKKGKGRGKAGGSTASKASRVSTQSAVTTTSDAPSQAESVEDIPIDSSVARVDDSILTAGTTTSTATLTKGKKKGGRTKAAAKGTKGRKKTSEEEDVEMLEQYPAALLSSQLATEEESAPAVSAQPTKTGGRGSKQEPIDSSIIEISAIEAAPPKKVTRGRKAKTQAEPVPEPEIAPKPQTPDANALEQNRQTQVSAQLLDQLEHSVDNFDGELDQSTPLEELHKSKRGVKRTSDGLRKQQESSVVEMVSPPPHPKPATKGKRGRKAKQTTSASTDIEQELVAEVDFAFALERRIELEPPESQGVDADDEKSQPTQAKAAAKQGKGKAKSRKASSARSSKATAAAAQSEPEEAAEEPEDLVRDEMEIEQELARIASEQGTTEEAQPMKIEQDLVDEYETSPSQGRISKDSAEIQQLQQDVDSEREPAVVEKAFTPPRKSQMPGGFTPSPGSSDKENQPSSVMQPQTAQKAPAIILSPTKTTRIPLAASTPDRSHAKSMLSPSKQMGGLISSAPWTAVDLDTVLLLSPQLSPGLVGEQLVAAAGALTSPEKKMSVEEWVRYRAAQGEEELRRKCERMVEAFERQGMRGLQSLECVEVVG